MCKGNDLDAVLKKVTIATQSSSSGKSANTSGAADEQFDFRKFLAPGERSPGKGSRDMMMQDARSWGVENIGPWLRTNGGDPYGVFDKEKVSNYFDKVKEAEANWKYQPGSEHSMGAAAWQFDPGSVLFTDFTPEQLQAYLGKQYDEAIKAGNPGNDAMWLPKLTDFEGKQYVTYGKRNGSKGGFLDKVSDYVGPALMMAAGGLAAAGAGVGAGAASGAAAGATLADAAALLEAPAAAGGSAGVAGTSAAGGITAKDALSAVQGINTVRSMLQPKPKAIGQSETVDTQIGDSGAAAASPGLVQQVKRPMSLLSRAGAVFDSLGSGVSTAFAKPTLGA